MNHANIILIVALLLQSTAAVLALRIHWTYGRRGAWWLISAAILLMAVHRGFELHRAFASGGSVPAIADLSALSGAWLSLMVSAVMLCGVVVIEPIFRGIARSEFMLRQERDELQHVVQEAEIELQMARQIQQSLLPVEAMRWKSLEVAGNCTFIKETGGDLFDFFPVTQDSALVYIADVSGHGLGPAMIATQVRTYVRALAEAGLTNPGAILNQLNRFLAENADGHFVTMFLAKVDPVAGEIEYTSAGHPAWLLDEHGGVTKLESLSIPLGINGQTDLSAASAVPLPPGGVLLLATDGLYEAYSPLTGTFGIDRAAEVVQSNWDRDGKSIVDRLQREVGAYSQEYLHDDVTTVVIKHLTGTRSSPEGLRQLASIAAVE